MRLPDAPRAAWLALVVVTVLALGAGSYGLTRVVRGHRPAPRPVAAPAVLGSAGDAPATSAAPTAPDADAARVRAALAPLVGSTALGSRLLAQVSDAASGTTLYGRGATTPAAPASTAKLLTAAAVLTVRAPTSRLTTTVRATADGRLVLVGAGDPTLSGAGAGADTTYAGAARLSDLAAAIRAQHLPVRGIVVDDGLFTGPSVSPAWAANDVPTDYASAITAVMADGGRTAPGATVRSATPDLAAGRELASLLGRPDVAVTRGSAPASSRPVASVSSAPLSVLVEQMLQESDNVIAECLARLVAVSEHLPATFTGGARAIRTVLARLGVRTGDGMKDGSGLAAGDRVAPAAITALLRVIVTSDRLSGVITALPVAGWSGTLQSRYLSGRSAGAAGRVHAKTGTLTGVSSLAGIVYDADGRALVFDLVADRVPATGTTAAEAALDAVAARLAACGCG